MNWVAFRHLWWVLLVLNRVGADDDEPSTRSSPVKLLKRPLLSDTIGNSIKKRPDDNYKSIISSDDALSGSTTDPHTSKRVNSNDYLARNTVPIASATESLRKFPKLRPPPSHLLAFQAASSTEKGFDSQIPPTGWALASLNPSKNAGSSMLKRNNVPLTPKPLNSYWSLRLHRVTPKSTTPLPSPDSTLLKDGSKNETVDMPVDNLIQNENNLESKSQKLSNSSTNEDSKEKESIKPISILNQIKGNDLKDRPATVETDVSTTPQSTTHASHTTPNVGKNLIKEVKSGDLGSSVLKGVVLATSGYRYAEDAKLDNRVLGSATESSVKPGKSHTENNEGNSSTVLKTVDDVNAVDLFPSVVKLSDEQGSEMSYDAGSPKLVESIESISHSPLNPILRYNTTLETPSTTLESTTVTVGSIKDVSDKIGSENMTITPIMSSNVTSTTTETNDLTTIARPSSDSATIIPYEEKPLSSDTPNSTSQKVLFSIAATTEMLPTQTSNTESNTIQSSSAESPTTPLLAPASTKASNQTIMKHIPSYTTSTVSQESNDIPEAYADIKKTVNFFNYSSFPTEANKFAYSTTPYTSTLIHEKPSNVSELSETTTNTIANLSISQSSNSSSLTVNSTPFTKETKTTTDAFALPTSAPTMADIPVQPVTEDDVSPETSTIIPTTFMPGSNVSKMENSTSSSDVTTAIVDGTETNILPDLIKPAATTQSVTTDSAIWMDDVTTPALLNVTKTPLITSIIHTTESYVGKHENEEEDTLKYNVTVVDQPFDKTHNGTEQDLEYDNNDKDNEDDTDKDNELPTTTTMIIIEEITTPRPQTTSTTPTIDSSKASTTTQKSSVNHPTNQFTTPAPNADEETSDPKLLLTFQASLKEMCLARESLTESLVEFIKGITMRPIQPDQIKILNLGQAECSSKSISPTKSVPLVLQVTNNAGQGDQNLTDLLFSYMKQGRFNFKYQLTNVSLGFKIPDGESEWGGTVIAAIAVSSVAGISLIFLTVLLVIMRNRQKGFIYGQRCTPVSLEDYSLDNISVFNSVRRKTMRASKRSYGNPAFDDPVTVTNPLNFVSLSSIANSHSKIDNEYSEVPTVTVKPDELPLGAETKNRYANVIPIPETRVPLSSSGGEEEFINANYVKGAKGAEKFYIACQAPLDSTIPDFWMMIWEQQAQVILMLTDLHENGSEKCADYLPPSEVLDCHRVFGNLQVTLKKREVREKYIISSLQLKNLEANLWREVVHLWYTGWPIRGVPDDLTSIIAYLIEARSYSKRGNPIVVHCSPGTGRSGTIIAIDIAIRDFETDRIVDIPKTVYSIRRDRAGAVQTNMQYYLIYQVIHLYATKLTGGGLD